MHCFITKSHCSLMHCFITKSHCSLFPRELRTSIINLLMFDMRLQHKFCHCIIIIQAKGPFTLQPRLGLHLTQLCHCMTIIQKKGPFTLQARPALDSALSLHDYHPLQIKGPFPLQPRPGLRLAPLRLGTGWCTLRLLSGSDLSHMFHVIIAADASSVCYTSRQKLCVLDSR